jgi:hypothetical protein
MANLGETSLASLETGGRDSRLNPAWSNVAMAVMPAEEARVRWKTGVTAVVYLLSHTFAAKLGANLICCIVDQSQVAVCWNTGET